MNRRTVIAVVGGGQVTPAVEARAEAVGREIARAGAALLCGGLGGVMAAAARGAAQEGGLTIGLLPGRRSGDANPWIEIALPTGLGHGRNLLVATGADALVAVDGALGTLSEIALAGIGDLPVIGLGTWQLDPARTGDFHIEPASTPEEAVARALERATERKQLS